MERKERRKHIIKNKKERDETYGARLEEDEIK
jgi:hypothetical protein